MRPQFGTQRNTRAYGLPLPYEMTHEAHRNDELRPRLVLGRKEAFIMNATLNRFKTAAMPLAAGMLALVLAFSLSACGGSGGSGSNSSSSSSTPRTAEANIDPTTLTAGQSNYGNDDATTYADYWYAEGDDKKPALCFDSNSIMTPVFLDEDGYDATVKYSSAKAEDGHLVPSGKADPDYDIVFDDPFTCYDFVTKTWYSRGDYTAALKKIVNTNWQAQGADYTMELKDDGTVIYSDEEESGTWHFTALDRIDIAPPDGEGFEYTIKYDDSGKATGLEWTFEGYGYDRIE